MMRRVPACLTAVAVVTAIMVMAPIARAQRGGPVGLAAGLQGAYAGLKANLTQSAEIVPEAGYGLKPSTMQEVRTYGQVIGHVSDAQFGQCSGALGTPNPNQGNSLEAAGRSRADIIKGLADSFALCDKAFEGLTDQNAIRDDPERPWRSGGASCCVARRDRPRQRDVRHLHRLPARAEHCPAINGGARTGTGRQGKLICRSVFLVPSSGFVFFVRVQGLQPRTETVNTNLDRGTRNLELHR